MKGLNDDDRKYLSDWKQDFNLIESKINRIIPSMWATEKRIMPNGLTPMPGPFRWEVTPYLKEIIDCFSSHSGVNKVVIMKGAQLGFSVGILENLIGWIIDCEPGPTLFVSADKELAESVTETRIDRMIESAGIGYKIFSQVEKKHGKKTGDTKSKKEFPGGFLLPVGPNMGPKLRSHSIRFLLFDEIDGYLLEIKSEGDPLAIAERRTDAFSRTRKILYISTPTTEDESRIKPLYETGDQSKYYVPCKHCGEFQVLSWDHIKFEHDEQNRLIWESVHYECESCGEHWKNDDKSFFLPRGEWRSTEKPMEPGLRSFHLSSLYSPIGFRTWESIAQEFIKVKNDPPKLRAFANTVLGETWQERGEAPSWEKIMLRREDYIITRLPVYANPLVLTLGADVQKDRIECELVAWCDQKESYSVGYYVLFGDTSNIESEAWKSIYNILTREHAGLRITMALIDSGYNTSVVYQFCEQFGSGVYPCMGESTQGFSRRTFALRAVAGYAVKRVDIQTNQLKAEIYGDLRKHFDGEIFPSGYCHFPEEYGEEYFKMLTAEERVKEKTKSGAVRMVWKQIRQRNESLDCRIYALAGLYLLASMISEELSPDDPIPWDLFWKILKGS
jgi:phage terminase large subunit GpA-like protein